MLTVLGGLAEFERHLILARTSEGRQRAQQRGVEVRAQTFPYSTSTARGIGEKGCWRGASRHRTKLRCEPQHNLKALIGGPAQGDNIQQPRASPNHDKGKPVAMAGSTVLPLKPGRRQKCIVSQRQRAKRTGQATS